MNLNTVVTRDLPQNYIRYIFLTFVTFHWRNADRAQRIIRTHRILLAANPCVNALHLGVLADLLRSYTVRFVIFLSSV